MRRGERLFTPFLDRVQAPAGLRDLVLTELGSPTRHWHGLVHHALMLRAVTRAGLGREETRRLVLATLFHDIVYDATRTDNEEASARVARDWLHDAESDAIAAMILATRHHDLDTDPVTRTLLEADLAVLWTASPRLYRVYADGIRAEYRHVPEGAYRAGRVAVLQRLEQQIAPHLTPARAALLARNLHGEIERLEG